MYNFKRNELIITVLVFMIAIGGYLQLKTNPENLPTFVTDEEIKVQEEVTDINSDNLMEFLILAPDIEGNNVDVNETIQNTTLTPSAAGAEVIISKIDGTEQTVSTNINSSEYFVEEKMIRDQSRSNEMAQLNDFISKPEIDADTKSKAAQSLLALQDKIDKENDCESLLRAKGFTDVFVRIDDANVDVMLDRTELTDEDIAQIEDIVSRATKYKVSQIRIHIKQ